MRNVEVIKRRNIGTYIHTAIRGDPHRYNILIPLEGWPGKGSAKYNPRLLTTDGIVYTSRGPIVPAIKFGRYLLQTQQKFIRKNEFDRWNVSEGWRFLGMTNAGVGHSVGNGIAGWAAP